MPILPILDSGLCQAVDSMLVKAGVTNPKIKFQDALIASGLTIDELASQLANLLYSGKERTRLEALKLALAGQGVDLREKDAVTQVPSIIFNITSNEQNVLNMFAPTREIKSLEEMSLENGEVI